MLYFISYKINQKIIVQCTIFTQKRVFWIVCSLSPSRMSFPLRASPWAVSFITALQSKGRKNIESLFSNISNCILCFLELGESSAKLKFVSEGIAVSFIKGMFVLEKRVCFLSTEWDRVGQVSGLGGVVCIDAGSKAALRLSCDQLTRVI